MKEKYVLMSSKELQLMLQGSLQWNDISPRITSSKAGMRKLGDPLSSPTIPKQSEQTDSIEPILPREKESQSKRIEGLPVIWLLGSVGLLTLSSWFYFVLFSN